MAIFFPPPSPHIGASQPLTPRDLPPQITAVPVNDPPFATGLRWSTEWLQLLQLWDPGPAAPTQARKLSPGIPGQSVDRPPVTTETLPYLLLRQWDPPDPPPRQKGPLSPGIPGQSINNPPLVYRVLQNEIARLWDAPPPEPVQNGNLSPGIPGQSIDNPPPSRKPLLRWDLPDWPIQQRAFYPIQIIITGDNPPFGMPQPWLFSTLRQWEPIPPTPIQYARIYQEFVATGDNPPFGIPPEWLWTVRYAWQEAPTIFQAQKLSPGIPGQSVDQPPLIYRITQSEVIRLWDAPAPDPVQKGKLSAGIPGQSVDQPPLRTTLNFITQVKAWEPSVIAPQRQIYLPQPFIVVSADNPPFGMPPDWLYSVLTGAWQPGQPLPKTLQKILQEGPAPVIATGQREKRKWRRSNS